MTKTFNMNTHTKKKTRANAVIMASVEKELISLCQNLFVKQKNKDLKLWLIIAIYNGGKRC